MRDRTGVVVVGLRSSSFTAYAGDRDAAEAAAQVAQQVTNQHGKNGRITVECWRPVSRQWADASGVSDGDLAEEHEFQQQEDRRLSAETGVAQWRVRVDLRGHRDTVALAHKLSIDGVLFDQSWKSIMASADCEDDALRLAEKIRLHAPAGADVFAERADATGTPDPAGPGFLDSFPGAL
jgi:hypothetical protein